MYRLDYVLTLAQEKNITKAAERLFISQPTLTKYINRLEEELGVKLFDRTVQPIQVTKAGIVFMEDMKKIQNRELMLKAKLYEISREKSSAIRVGMANVRGEYLLPKALKHFVNLYPDVSVNVDNDLEGRSEGKLAKGEVDVAVGVLSTAYEELSYELLGEYEIMVLLSRARLPELKENEGTYESPYSIDPVKLNGMRVLLPNSGGGQYQAWDIASRKHDIVPFGEIRCGNLHTLYQLVASDCGFLFSTPRDFIKRFPEESKNIAFCRIHGEKMTQKAYVAVRREDKEDPMIKTFVEGIILSEKAQAGK